MSKRDLKKGTSQRPATIVPVPPVLPGPPSGHGDSGYTLGITAGVEHDNHMESSISTELVTNNISNGFYTGGNRTESDDDHATDTQKSTSYHGRDAYSIIKQELELHRAKQDKERLKNKD